MHKKIKHYWEIGGKKYSFYLLLFVSFVTVVWINISAGVTFDSGDGIHHYLISLYSWTHPHLFLHSWGKPFFTLVSSPFAQFGIKGMIVFQALCAGAVSFFCYKITEKLNLKYSWTIPVFVFFAPIFFAVLNTGLTEIFFGCQLMFSIWLFFEKKHIPSAIIASFLPFIRIDAYVVLPIIAFVLLLKKQFLAVPLLFSGFFIYSIIGFFHFHDFLWIIHHSQSFFNEGYEGGKGDFFHYINHYEDILGTPYSVLFIAGFIRQLYVVSKCIIYKIKFPFLVEEIFLIFGTLVACFLLHAFSYWMPGVLTNLGMMRYMATLIPGAAIIAVMGMNIITLTWIKKFFYFETGIVILLIVLVINSPFKQLFYPFRVDAEQAVVKETGDWIRNIYGKNHRICYMHPYLAYASDIDPFDERRITLLWSLDKERLNLLPDSTLIIWDSHYAPQEGNLRLDLLRNDTNFIQLKYYKYYLDAFPFEIRAFMKINIKNTAANLFTPELVSEEGSLNNLQIIDSVFFDFDVKSSEDKSMLVKDISFSGHTSLAFTANNEWGPVFTRKISQIKNYLSFRMVEIEFKFYTSDSVREIIPVIEINKGKKIILWYGENINQQVNLNTWNDCKIKRAFLPSELNQNYYVNFYFWNKSRKRFFVDDICIYYYGFADVTLQ
ncbi:MAG: hypothetical protein HYY40_12770 [Bacteroidetes bacterium]|nr:hypothetical protein [Bacteroidota bacterium]